MEMTAAERRSELIRRPWTRAERAVVLQGFLGRLAIAVEPLICCIVFVALTLGLLVRGNLIVLSPIFGLGALAFAIYAVALMVRPVRALFETAGPIFIVDGYVRYRGPADDGDVGGFVAVLTHDRRVAGEWRCNAGVALPDVTRAALVEFSAYGGIHRIDGRLTGILPEKIDALGVNSSLHAGP